MPLFGTSGCRNPPQGQKVPQEPQSTRLPLQRNFWKPRPSPQRGQEWKQGGNHPPGVSLPVTSGGLTHQTAQTDSVDQLNFVKPWCFWFLRAWSEDSNRTCLGGCFQDSIASPWKHLAKCLSPSESFDSFLSPQILMCTYYTHSAPAARGHLCTKQRPRPWGPSLRGGLLETTPFKILLLSLLGII